MLKYVTKQDVPSGWLMMPQNFTNANYLMNRAYLLLLFPELEA